MANHYAIDAANRMVAALDDRTIWAPLRVRNALHIGCENLCRVSLDLNPDGPLARDLKFLEKAREDSRSELNRAFETVQTFSEAFRHIEVTALKKAGASERLLRFFNSDRESLLNSLSEENLTPEHLKSRIDRLKESVCESRDSLVSLYLDPSKLTQARKILRRGALGLFGAGAVSANAATDIITTLGLAPWASALSGVVGSAAVGEAIFGKDE